MSSRTYDIAFRLNAKLGSKYGKAFQQAQSKAEQLATTLNAVGRRMTLAVTAPLVALGTAAVVVGTDMENSMGNIQAHTQMAAYEVAELESNFRSLAMGSDYFSFTAREIAAAYGEVAVAGQDVAHGTELMSKSAVFASATNLSLANATSFLSNSLVKTNADVSSATRYINIFAGAASYGGVNMNKLEKAIIAVTPSMNQFEMSLEETVGALNVLYQGTIYGTAAGRGLEQMFNAVTATTGNSAEAMSRLGVSAFDASTGTLRPMNDILLDVMKALDGVSDAQELLTIRGQLFSTVYGNAVFDELSRNRDAWQENIEVMYEAGSAIGETGVAFQMAAIQNEGMAGSTAQLRASMEELMLQISDHLLPHAVNLIGLVTSAVEWFGNLDDGTQRNIIRFAALAAAIGPAMIITSKLIKVFVAGRQAVQGFTLAKAGYTAMATKSAAATNATVVGATAYTAIAKAGTIATKGWTLAKSAWVTVLGLATGKIKLVTVAQKIWNIIMMMNPIFLLVAVIMAVIIALAALAMWLFRGSEETRRLQEETDALVERQQALTNGMYESAVAFEAQRREMAETSEVHQHLADRLYGLANSYNLTAFEMENLHHDIETLNQSIPGLNLAFNEQTGELNMTAEALQRYIGLAEKQLEIDASRARQLELVRERSQAEYELAAIQAQQAEVQEALNNLGGHQFIQRGRLNDQLDDLAAAEEALNYAIANNVSEYENLGDIMAQNAKYLEEHRRMQEEAAIATYGFEMAMRRAAFTAEEWADAQNDALSKMSASFENHIKVAGNAFDTVNQNATISFDEMIANMNANAAAVTMWSDNLAVLVNKGLDEGLIEQLRKMGPAAADQVALLVQELEAVPNRLYELNDAFASSSDAAMGAMINELDPMGVAESAEELIDHVALAILENQAMENALINKVNAGFAAFADTIDYVGFDNEGYNISYGIGEGVRDGSIYLERAMVYISQNGEQALRNYWAMNSPSRKMRGFGKNLMGSMSDGMYSMTGELIKTCKDVSEDISDNLVVVPPAIAELMQSGKVAGYISAVGAVKAPTNTEDNAVSSLTNFSRYENLQATGTDNPSPFSNRPVDAMSRLDEANATYAGDTMSFNYAPVIQISGGGYNNDELQDVISEALQGTYGEVENIVKRVIREEQARKRRLAN